MVGERRKQSRYLHDEEIGPLAEQIEWRKALQEELRSLKAKPSKKNKKRNDVNSLKCTLMHKRTKVAEIELDDSYRVYTEDRLGVCAGASAGGCSGEKRDYRPGGAERVVD